MKSAWAKSHRAYQQVKNLERKIMRGFNDGHYGVRAKRDDDLGDIRFETFHSELHYTRFSLLIGEIAHNLRSCLDHVAWQLASVPDKGTAFPIAVKENDWKRSFNRELKTFSDDRRSFINCFQPYLRGNRASKHPLAILQKLNNTDKHSLLNVMAWFVEAADLEAVSNQTGQVVAAHPLVFDSGNANAKLGDIPIPPSGMNVNFKGAIGITVTEPRENLTFDVFADLPLILRSVRTIVYRSERCFT